MTMVERCARAICDCEAAGPISWSAAKVVARAMLQALREPDEAMLDAANALEVTKHVDAMATLAMTHGVEPLPQEPTALVQWWQAMIDAILEGE